MWLPRRWSELGIRDLPSHDFNRPCAGSSITVHLPPSGEAAPCVGTRRRLCSSRLHRQREVVLCETARVLGCHESRNPWTPWIPRQCASIRVLGRIVEWTADDITWEADPRHAELIRKSFGVTGRELETNSLTLKERFRSTKKRQIGIVRMRCVHSISPVTDLIYRSSAVIWHARCNSRRTWMKWD